MPLLPGITDGEEDLDTLAYASSQAGAAWFSASVLFLMPSSREQFLPFLRREFPHLARRYEGFYGGGRVYPPETYRREIAARVAALRKKYGLSLRLPEATHKEVSPPQQLNMSWAPST
jgi:hypothetical protein